MFWEVSQLGFQLKQKKCWESTFDSFWPLHICPRKGQEKQTQSDIYLIAKIDYSCGAVRITFHFPKHLTIFRIYSKIDGSTSWQNIVWVIGKHIFNGCYMSSSTLCQGQN